MDKVEQKNETAILPNPCYVQCGDNLELLKSQPNESVNMIYSDILYGTGRNFGEYQDLKPIRSEIESHYLPRLIEMKRVLKQNGSIYLQMDTRINHWMRILMDDVFGYENFRNEISWCYNSQGKTTKQWNKKHDVILYYTKSEDWVFNSDIVKDSISDLTYRRFQKEIDKYGYYTVLKNGKRTQYTLADGSLPKDWFEDVTYISRDNKELTGYPTQKPKELTQSKAKLFWILQQEAEQLLLVWNLEESLFWQKKTLMSLKNSKSVGKKKLLKRINSNELSIQYECSTCL